ncbi:MAG: hypothetical protein U5S82_22495 [Gammaproteobacteria bacterium]|nr:hypothetical protein [Gammaproteobacteria bacterium]
MEMGIFGQLMWGAVAILALFLFMPGLKAAMQKSREAENKDWAGALIPIALVAAFVVLLIMAV